MNESKMDRIRHFIKTWKGHGHEIADKVTYWNTLLSILGVPQQKLDDNNYISYEKRVNVDKNDNHFRGWIDAYIPSTRVLIEQKSSGVGLYDPENRPNGDETEKITPFQQARRYNINLGVENAAKFIVVCNFDQIAYYDVRKSYDVDPVLINIEELTTSRVRHMLDFLVEPNIAQQLAREKSISVDAGGLVSKLYDGLAAAYAKFGLTDEKTKHSINMLCVRLVFCLYAEDAGLFNKSNQFHDYLAPLDPSEIGEALKDLFKVLDTKEPDRNKENPFWTASHPQLAQFNYVNGGLFADESIIIPPFTKELKHILVDEACAFDWSGISPTIFGSVFESTLNPDTRRKGGMHYTSIENIHRIIDPLFLNDLRTELDKIKEYKNDKTVKEKAKAFQEKLANITIFDPACGSGNFLTESYLSLRRLENEALRLQYKGMGSIVPEKDSIKVSIQQFYGIEINDFAVSVAKTALWIAEDQMMKKTQDELLYVPDWKFLPLTTYNKIYEGNALRMDWNKIIPNYACHYIISNPPFIGLSSLPAKHRDLKKQQTDDMNLVFKDLKRHGKLDYVTAWYEKAADYMKNNKVKAAFVSTNSITQGEQVGILWKHLIEDKNLIINFAYRSFVWDNEAKDKAHVHCVIIGFSIGKGDRNKFIVNEDGRKTPAKHINGYLIDYPDIYIKSRKKEVPFGLPEMHKGSQPTDGGGLTLTSKAAKELLNRYPQLKDCIKLYLGADELIKNRKRYCLWLKGISPNVYRSIPEIRARLEHVVESRKKSTTPSVRNDDSRTPYLFTQIRQPDTDYMAIPEVSSENRYYVPIDFLSKDVIASNKLYLLQTTERWIFAVLTSSVHMDWMRTVAGRLETRYSYSPAVYANFPWIEFSDEEKEALNKTGQAILNARKLYPEASFADLYDTMYMPPELLKAHEANDKLVLKLYGWSSNLTDSEIVANLFKMYEQANKSHRSSKK